MRLAGEAGEIVNEVRTDGALLGAGVVVVGEGVGEEVVEQAVMIKIKASIDPAVKQIPINLISFLFTLIIPLIYNVSFSKTGLP